MNFTKEDVARKILEHVDYYLHFAEVGTDADQRNYEVSYEKIRKKGFETTVDLDRGIAELVRAAQAHRVPEPVRQRLNPTAVEPRRAASDSRAAVAGPTSPRDRRRRTSIGGDTMKSFWSDKRVTVTGGAGFLGQHLVRRLESFGAKVFVPRQRDYNLTALDACLRCLLEHPCDLLFHAAAYYGGIGINVDRAGEALLHATSSWGPT